MVCRPRSDWTILVSCKKEACCPVVRVVAEFEGCHGLHLRGPYLVSQYALLSNSAGNQRRPSGVSRQYQPSASRQSRMSSAILFQGRLDSRAATSK